VIPFHRDGLLMSFNAESAAPKYQLLFNYCFGHVKSNILLLPYGPGIQYINHHSTAYNAIVRWSTSIPPLSEQSDDSNTNTNNKRRRRPKWIVDPQYVTIEQLHEQYQQTNVDQIPKLVMELVAIRDIQYGEEILIDYGMEWEKAFTNAKMAQDQLNISTVLTPEKVNDPIFLQDFIDLCPDLCITAAYGQYLPKRFLQTPKYGTVNIHPSLLPKWRGASPVQRSLEMGDNPVGVSVLYTISKLDAGPIITQIPVSIDDHETATSVLHNH
jgi:Formyl transferase